MIDTIFGFSLFLMDLIINILIIKINIKVIMKNMTEIKKIMKMMKLFMNNKIIIQYKIHLNKNIRVIIIIIIDEILARDSLIKMVCYVTIKIATSWWLLYREKNTRFDCFRFIIIIISFSIHN